MKFYLDHNIYIYSLADKLITQAIKILKSNSVQFIYSPAHIEEIYAAYAINSHKYFNARLQLLKQISEITDNMECFPSESNIIIVRESPYDCYLRIDNDDTKSLIDSIGQQKYHINKNHYHQICESDKYRQSISNLEFDKIWQDNEIISYIETINENMPITIKEHNSSKFVQNLKSNGINILLPEDLQIEFGMYSKIKHSHNLVEFIIDQLFSILNINGYNADKKEITTISGIHDVTHSIYATVSDKLFTTDQRFAKKCMAVYYYLGVDTEVIFCHDKDKISEILISSL